MIRRHVTFVVTLGICALAMPAAAEETESRLGESEPDCLCPKPGLWLAKNREGWMDCSGPLPIKRKLKQGDPNKGIIWILEDDCSSFFVEALEKKRDDVLMKRVEGCAFQGTLWGEEDGIEVLIAMNAELENDELMTGEMYLNPEEEEDSEKSKDPVAGEESKDRKNWKAGSGMEFSCKGYRGFETTFLEPLSEEEYPKLEKRMEKKLKEFHEKNRSGPPD